MSTKTNNIKIMIMTIVLNRVQRCQLKINKMRTMRRSLTMMKKKRVKKTVVIIWVPNKRTLNSRDKFINNKLKSYVNLSFKSKNKATKRILFKKIKTFSKKKMIDQSGRRWALYLHSGVLNHTTRHDQIIIVV